MKWDNCIKYPKDGEGSEMGLKVVDWELADLGDPCWDVGAIFQAYISFWILSMQITEAVPPERLVELAQYPLEGMQPAIQAFWDAYVGTLQTGGKDARELLERSMKYGAARMIQTAYEYMQYSPQISANTLCLLQVSVNILTRPKEAITHLLGM